MSRRTRRRSAEPGRPSDGRRRTIPGGPATVIEITGLASSTGSLIKRIGLSPDGKLVSDGPACVMSCGWAKRVHLSGVVDLSVLIGSLDSNEAIALGALRSNLPDLVEITTARRLAEMDGAAPPGLIPHGRSHRLCPEDLRLCTPGLRHQGYAAWGEGQDRSP